MSQTSKVLRGLRFAPDHPLSGSDMYQLMHIIRNVLASFGHRMHTFWSQKEKVFKWHFYMSELCDGGRSHLGYFLFSSHIMVTYTLVGGRMPCHRAAVSRDDRNSDGRSWLWSWRARITRGKRKHILSCNLPHSIYSAPS